MKTRRAGHLCALGVAFAVQARVQSPAPAVGDDVAGVLLLESFATEAALGGWERMDGAVSGDGPESRALIEEGALCLAGEKTTGHWLALQRSVPLKGASCIRLSARMRTQEVDRSSARFANCNLYLRFPNAALETTPILEGSVAWTPIARRLAVPEGASSVTLGCFLSMPGRVWFDDVRLEAVPAPAWSNEEHALYVYHVLPGDRIPPDAVAYNQESLELACAFLGVEPGPPIHFYKYPERETKLELTGDGGNAFARAERREVHTLWARDRHEIVHVLALPLGKPPALLGEGLAVFLSGSWQQRPVAEYARDLARAGQWIPLADLLDTADFRGASSLVSYAEAGAFVGWVEHELGREALLALYAALQTGQSRDWNRTRLHEVLGLTLEEVEHELRAGLEER